MKDSTKARDEWLAQRFKAGLPGAMEDLIAELERPLFYYAVKLTGNRDTAFDVLQEVWIQALHGIQKLKDASSVRAWLYTMVHGTTVDKIRRERLRERAEEIHTESFDDSCEPQFAADQADAVDEMLEKIDRKHREVLVLHFLEDFSLLEIAGILRCPEGTIKSRLHYAKRALKEAISGEKDAI
jgi:RNA polymerase sigma-70 factor (ECF subfamily)